MLPKGKKLNPITPKSVTTHSPLTGQSFILKNYPGLSSISPNLLSHSRTGQPRLEFIFFPCSILAIMNKITVLNKEIELYTQNEADYICLTDIAMYKDPHRSNYIIQNWLRNRTTIEFLGLWEIINNPNFNPIEFDGFRNPEATNMIVY